MSRIRFAIELRDQKVELDVAITAAEPDVGIMGEGFEDEIIRDDSGKVLDWELTDDEIQKVLEAVGQIMFDSYQDLE